MQVKVIPFEPDPGSDGQLSLPLFYSDKAPVIQLPTHDHTKSNSYEWTDREISFVREKLLMETLKNLTDGRAIRAKSEAMEWMMSDKAQPFSFRTCANSMGLSHEKIRSRVLSMIDRLESKTSRP